MKTAIIRLQVFVLLIPVCISFTGFPVSASTLFNIDNDWNSAINSAFSSSYPELSILKELNRIDRFAAYEFTHQEPYRLSSPGNNINIKNTGHIISLHFPFITHGQVFAIRFDTDVRELTGTVSSGSGSSRLRAKDELSSSHFLIAHQWKNLQALWGVSLRWWYRGVDSRLEPAWEFGWGDVSATRFRVRLYTRVIDTPWNWTLSDSELPGQFATRVQGTHFELAFGEPFSTQMRVVLGDADYRALPDPDKRPFRLVLDGSERYLGLFLEKQPLDKIGWKTGGSHTNFDGGLSLYKNDLILGNGTETNYVKDHLTCQLSGELNHYLRWGSDLSFNRFQGRLNGWLLMENLPGAFAGAFDGNTYYRGDSELQSVSACGRLSLRQKSFSCSFETGWVDLVTDIGIEDFPIGSESEITRETRIPLDGFGAAWVTLSGNFSFRQWTVACSMSQAKILYSDTPEGAAETAGDVSGGLLVSLKLIRRL